MIDRRLFLLPILFVTGLVSIARAQTVIRDSVQPRWTQDGQQFWYETDLGQGRSQFWFVDAKRRIREPLFDLQPIAKSLEAETKTSVSIDDLRPQVIGFESEANTVTIAVAGRIVTLDRKTGTLTWAAGERIALSSPLFLPPKPSLASAESVSFAAYNQLDQPLEILWVDFQGNLNSYATLEPGKSFEISSYQTHVWLFRTKDQQNLGCFELSDSADLKIDQAMIDRVETRSPPAAGRRNRSGRRGRRAIEPGISSNASFGPASPDRKYRLEVRQDNLWLIANDKAEEAKALTTDGDSSNSFRRNNQAARILHMQYRAGDFPESEADAIWEPNSRYVVAWQTRVVPERRVELKPSNPEKHAAEDLSYPYAKPGDPLPAKTVRLFDATKGIEIPIEGADFSNPWNIGLERFNRNGKQTWLQYHQRGHQKIQIVRIDLETGKAKVVIEENGPTFLHYSAGVKYRLWWLDDTKALWSSERTGWNHLYRIDMLTGEVLNAVTQGDWHVKRVEKIGDGKVWFTAVGIVPDQDPYHEHACRVDLDGSNFIRLTAGDGMHSISWSPTGEYLIDQYSRVDLPTVHELRTADGKLIFELERGEFLDTDSASASNSQKPPKNSERFSAKGRDGKTEIWGVVHFPRDFDSSKSYPIIESIYAGPHDYHVPKRFSGGRAFENFTRAGFVIVQIDGMGTAWRSKAFHDVCYRNLRDAGFPDRIAWIKALAKKYPNLDLNRVGIFGGSAGGQNAMAALLWHHDFYKVAVADCGCHDNRMDKVWWNEQWMGTVEPGNHYVENSNLENAHLLKGKLLLIVGELDRNVDPASTLEVASKLKGLGKQDHFELLAIPDTGHGAAESQRGQRRRMEFFKQQLLEVQ
jgi:dipeptidyl aminopeptidase/acylaminoacyl peptidase